MVPFFFPKITQQVELIKLTRNEILEPCSNKEGKLYEITLFGTQRQFTRPSKIPLLINGDFN